MSRSSVHSLPDSTARSSTRSSAASSTPRRILLLNERDPGNPLAGGCEVHTFEVFGRLAARGHDVTLLSATFPGCEPEAEYDGIRVRRLCSRYLYYGMAPFAARREIARGGYDVVVDILSKLPFLSPWMQRVPTFTVVHHLFGDTAFRQVAWPVAAVTWLSEKLIPASYRRTVTLAVSPSTRADLVERGLEAERIFVVPNGLDPEAYSDLPPKPDSLGIVWIGRLEPYKRADLLVDAMPEILRRVPGASFVILGEGTARESLERRVTELGLGDAVSFRGFVTERAKVEALAEAAVAVHTSEKEGWGITVLEGNACGTPCVASDVPGLRDSVRDGETGLLFPFGDRNALIAAVVRVLTDDSLRRELRDAGVEWARRFSWDRAANDTETLLELSISGAAGRPALEAWPEDS